MYEGHDQTETVHVVLDGAASVTDVRVARGWQAKVDSRRFGQVVLEAVEAAGKAQLAAVAGQWVHNQDIVDEPEPAAVEPIEINPSRATMDHLLNLLDRADSAIHALTAERPTPTTTGRSAGGHVTVSLTGQRVVDVDMERRWVGVANNLEIAGELRSAFASAYTAAAEAKRLASPPSGPIAELKAMTNDPNEFIANLFGIRR